MLRIKPEIIEGIRKVKERRGLYRYLQSAIELEHSTIPPYLTAYYSLKPGLNDEVARLLRSVVIEEMLHMTIAANILISLGGRPAINHPDFVPDYPGPLPMGIGGDGFIVHIAPLSMPLIRDTFMVIEEPEQPIEVETLGGEAEDEAPTYRTIGEFYDALKQKLAELPPSDFGHVDRQVLSVFSPKETFPIVNARAANRAIDVIIRQGEGTSTDPIDPDGEPAHYYRFGEIYYGCRLVRRKEKGSWTWTYDGEPIAFVSDGVFPMRPDPTAEQFPPGTRGRLLSDNFTAGYSAMLNALHEAFNGHPDRIQAALGLMMQLRFMAQTLMSTPLQRGQVATAGPVFKYTR